ncbi:MAG: starch-binding protein [Ruminococcus sp.]|nr:starch-binding protein [Ruminococcus sp.]
MKKVLSIILCAVIIVSAVCVAAGVVTSAAAASLNYNFVGSHAKDKGWAQGDIIVTAGPDTGGTYYLYWADDTKALDGFDYIAKLSVSANGSAKFTMPQYTAIPADATKIAGFLSTSEPSDKAVSQAKAVYDIPADKRIGQKSSEKLYSFASYSDFHISEGSYGLTNYPYDNEHELAAWNVAAARNVDFVVTTGDHINNQREDEKGGNNPYAAAEWRTYLKNLANSNYTGPVYEAIGNHELWNYDTESDYKNKDWKTGSKAFVTATGLDSSTASVNSGNAYYEITEPTTGDHFLFMSLEGGFYTDRVDEFSTAQLTWLENKLKAYQNDGHNIFILEHSNFYKWGSGDQLNKPIYDIPLKDSNTSTVKLKNLLQTYKTPIFLSGHTHFKFSLQLNYSDNNGTSATMIHNSSVGAVRDIQGGTTRVNDKSLQNTEGYIVEVYNGATIFHGINLYYDKIIPTATYIVETAGEMSSPTEAPTDPPTEPEPVTEPPTEPEPVTDPPTEAPTRAPATAPPLIWGDADLDGVLSVIDATYIQKHLASIIKLDPDQLFLAMVDGTNKINIIDATLIQKRLASVISIFPIEEELASSGADYEIVEEGAVVELEEAAGDLNTLRTQANTALTKYYALASYDQYQALKKAYKENANYDTLYAAYNSFNSAVTSFYSSQITIYFNNNKNWSNVYAYCWDGSAKNASWPGQKCTKSGNQYKITVERGKYVNIIFNNSSDQQTIDLPLFDIPNIKYTPNSSSSPYKVKYE